MPNLFGNLPADTLLDAGILSIGATPFAVSRGGLTGVVEPQWRAVTFGSAHTPIMGLDRKVGIMAKIRGTFVEFGPADLLVFQAQETGGALGSGEGAPSLAVAVAAAMTVAAAAALSSSAVGVIDRASDLVQRNRYLSDLRLTFQRGGGGDVRIIFPVALCTKYDLKGKDKEEAEIAAEFEARLDLSATNDTDRVPYYIEVR